MTITNKINFRKLTTAASLSVLVCAASISDSYAGTLENLERERALVIESILNPELKPEERAEEIERAKPRLVDLERVVLRDSKMKGRNTATVRRAFENYDLTFMLHAATERNLSITDNWLSQIGITTQSVMSAPIRRRSVE